MEIYKINHKTIKHVTVYEIYVAVKVIKSKLIIIILEERKRYRAPVWVQNFLKALRSLGGNTAMLLISISLSTIKLLILGCTYMLPAQM